MYKQKTTNCLQAQICATLLTHSVSETEMLCVLVVKLVVKLKNYWHDKKRVEGEKNKKRKD